MMALLRRTDTNPVGIHGEVLLQKQISPGIECRQHAGALALHHHTFRMFRKLGGSLHFVHQAQEEVSAASDNTS